MKLLTKVLLTLFLISIIAGCVEQTKADSGRFTVLSGEKIGMDEIDVIHDNTNNVTIYIYHHQFDGGAAISAIPDNQLEQSKGD